MDMDTTTASKQRIVWAAIGPRGAASGGRRECASPLPSQVVFGKTAPAAAAPGGSAAVRSMGNFYATMGLELTRALGKVWLVPADADGSRMRAAVLAGNEAEVTRLAVQGFNPFRLDPATGCPVIGKEAAAPLVRAAAAAFVDALVRAGGVAATFPSGSPPTSARASPPATRGGPGSRPNNRAAAAVPPAIMKPAAASPSPSTIWEGRPTTVTRDEAAQLGFSKHASTVCSATATSSKLPRWVTREAPVGLGFGARASVGAPLAPVELHWGPTSGMLFTAPPAAPAAPAPPVPAAPLGQFAEAAKAAIAKAFHDNVQAGVEPAEALPGVEEAAAAASAAATEDAAKDDGMVAAPVPAKDDVVLPMPEAAKDSDGVNKEHVLPMPAPAIVPGTPLTTLATTTSSSAPFPQFVTSTQPAAGGSQWSALDARLWTTFLDADVGRGWGPSRRPDFLTSDAAYTIGRGAD